MKKSVKLFCLALAVLILAAIVVKGVDTGWGSVDVKLEKTISAHGYTMSYKLYVPKSATPENPAPAIVWMVGGGASLDEASMVAVEAARRGYIVITADVPGNGQSESIIATENNRAEGGGPVNSMAEGFAYTSAAMDIVKSLSVTDTSQIVLGGHSMGAIYTTNVAQQRSEEIVANLIMGFFGFPGNPQGATDFNYCLIVGKGDEASLVFSTGYRTLSEGYDGAPSRALFGLGEDEPIEVGKLYGSYADQSARIVYTPNLTHWLEPTSMTCMSLLLHELEASTTAPIKLANNNFTFWIKSVAMFVVYADLALLIFATVLLLLDTKVFADLIIARENKHIGFADKSPARIIAIVLLTVLTSCLFIWGFQNTGNFPFVGTLGNAGGKALWSVGTAVLLAAYLVVFHFIKGKKNGANAGDYGLATTDSKGFDPIYILKSLLFGLTVFAIVYAIYMYYVTFTQCNAHVVLFCTELSPIEPTKLVYKGLAIFLMMFCFIFVNAIAQKTIVGKNGSMVKDVILTNVVGTAGFVVLFAFFVGFLLGPHICLFAKNGGCYGAETLLGVTFSFWMINTSIYYLNKKTNSIWAGTITAAVLMTWMSIYATGMTF